MSCCRWISGNRRASLQGGTHNFGLIHHSPAARWAQQRLTSASSCSLHSYIRNKILSPSPSSLCSFLYFLIFSILFLFLFHLISFFFFVSCIVPAIHTFSIFPAISYSFLFLPLFPYIMFLFSFSPHLSVSFTYISFQYLTFPLPQGRLLK